MKKLIQLLSEQEQNLFNLARSKNIVDQMKVLEDPKVAEIKDESGMGTTPLHFLAVRGHPQVQEKLLNHPDVDIVKDKGGNTPLDILIVRGASSEIKQKAKLMKK